MSKNLICLNQGLFILNKPYLNYFKNLLNKKRQQKKEIKKKNIRKNEKNKRAVISAGQFDLFSFML